MPILSDWIQNEVSCSHLMLSGIERMSVKGGSVRKCTMYQKGVGQHFSSPSLHPLLKNELLILGYNVWLENSPAGSCHQLMHSRCCTFWLELNLKQNNYRKHLSMYQVLSLFNQHILPIFHVKNKVKLISPTLSLYKHTLRKLSHWTIKVTN